MLIWVWKYQLKKYFIFPWFYPKIFINATSKKNVLTLDFISKEDKKGNLLKISLNDSCSGNKDEIIQIDPII